MFIHKTLLLYVVLSKVWFVFRPSIMSDHDDASNESRAHAPVNDSSGGAEREKSGVDKNTNANKTTDRQSQADQTAQAIKTLAQAVQEIRNDMKALKRKQENDDNTVSKKAKQTRSTEQTDTERPGPSSEDDKRPNRSPEDMLVSGDQNSDSEESEDDELDHFMEAEKNGEEENDQDTLSDLEDFFEQDDGTGDDLSDRMAKITDKALRGKKSKKEDEKLKKLREKHKHPKNVENLQAPTVDDFAWRQMRREVKRVDYALKKGVLDCAQAITPLGKALELMQTNSNHEATKSNVMDAFKILCLIVKTTNNNRLELIKKEMQPKYRELCPEQPSATKLLGDNFQEAVKKLDGTKSNLTMSSMNFLGRRGGDRHQSSYHRDQNNSSNYRRNFNHQQRGKQFYNNNQNYQGGKYQQKGNNKSKNAHSTRK